MVFFCKFAKCGFGVHFCGFGVHFCGFGVIFCGFSVRFCGFRVRPSLTCPRRRCPPLPRQPPACCSRSARCPTTGAPARSPSCAAPSRKARSRRAYSAIGATSLPRRHLATGRRTRAAQRRTTERPPPRLGAAHGSNRCRPTTRLLPLPLSAMRPLRQCTPRTRRQIPLRRAIFAAMRPPPALIITTRLLSYTFLPCAGERTAAATVEPRVGRGNGLLARRCSVPARSWRVQGCACGV